MKFNWLLLKTRTHIEGGEETERPVRQGNCIDKELISDIGGIFIPIKRGECTVVIVRIGRL